MAYKEGKKWRAVVRYTDSTGKLHRRTKFFEKKREATGWERDTLKALQFADAQNRSLQTAGQLMTVGLWAELYLDYAQQKWPGKTYSEKQRAFQRFFATVGDPMAPITSVRASMALDCLTALSKNYSGSNVNRVRKNLIAGWNWGVKYHELPRDNPFASVDKFQEKPEPRYVPPLEDLQVVLELSDNYQKLVLLTAFYSAARKSELFRLKWDEVDFAGNQIGLWTRKRRGGHWELDKVPMTKTLRGLLAERKLQYGHEEFVFDQGKMMRDSKNKWLKRLCALAGVKAFGFHGIRHLSESIGIDSGATVLDVQQLLRHKSAQTTMRYLHRMKSDNRAVDALEDVMADFTSSGEPAEEVL